MHRAGGQLPTIIREPRFDRKSASDSPGILGLHSAMPAVEVGNESLKVEVALQCLCDVIGEGEVDVARARDVDTRQFAHDRTASRVQCNESVWRRFENQGGTSGNQRVSTLIPRRGVSAFLDGVRPFCSVRQCD